jgi:hypothetical protein
MSYDIWLEADLGGPKPITVGNGWNYTSNMSDAWREAGADLAQFDGKTAGECAFFLSLAIDRMKADPDKYRAFNAPNGWGSYDTLVPALDQLLALFRTAPRATVVVSR